jgi:probable F420-dependent oxidoreductase
LPAGRSIDSGILRFTVYFPLHHLRGLEGFVDAEHVSGFAQVVEAAGFSVLGFADHPASSREWLNGEHGHAAFDPFVALGYSAARTSHMKLMTYIAVAAYRNPLLLAKAATTVDILSGGRFILAVGGGYLEPEFRALGAEFSERGKLLDEQISVLETVWSGNPFNLKGEHWVAEDHQQLPTPIQKPGPPIWIGGAGDKNLRRVARVGSGWTPLMTPPGAALPWVRHPLDSYSALRKAIARLRELLDEAGRGEEQVDVQVKTPFSRMTMRDFHAEQHLEQLQQLSEAGATHFVVDPMDNDPQAMREFLARYGEEVVTAMSGPDKD